MGEVLLSLVVAVVASFFTVHLSLRSFHRQKLWEKKEEAYSEIIAGLYDAKRFYSDAAKGHIHDANKSDDIGHRYWQSNLTLQRHANIGELVIDRDAIDKIEYYHGMLVELVQRIADRSVSDDWSEESRQLENIADECIKTIIPIARKDLETTGSLFGGLFERMKSCG